MTQSTCSHPRPGEARREPPQGFRGAALPTPSWDGQRVGHPVYAQDTEAGELGGDPGTPRWTPAPTHPPPLRVVDSPDAGRAPALLPRYQRQAATPPVQGQSPCTTNTKQAPALCLKNLEQTMAAPGGQRLTSHPS